MGDKASADRSGTGISCSRCGAGSVLQVSSNLIAAEFAMTCTHCGYRGVYRRDDVRAVTNLAGAADPPRRG
jgi:hypothetical protein